MKNKTSLCIGPVSKNGVDAVLEITNEFNIPISLVLSRNQIETEKIGHGYVNNWTTKRFSKYANELFLVYLYCVLMVRIHLNIGLHFNATQHALNN